MSFVKPLAALSKNIIKRTSFGKKIVSIKQQAMFAKQNPLKFESPALSDQIFSMVGKAFQNSDEMISDLVRNQKIIKDVKKYTSNVQSKISNLSVKSKNSKRVFTESLGVSPNKFLQIISSDEEILKKLPESFRKAAESSRSQNMFTRTMDEAQKEIAELFKGKYTLKKQLGAGTIGEAYLAQNAANEEVVVKMIKKGIDIKSLEAEEAVFVEMAKAAFGKDKNGQQKVKMFQSLYKDWKKELDFRYEDHYNRTLAKGAKRFKVAGIKDLSNDARAIVYEKAQGVQADKFLQMLKDYKVNPKEYASKYSKEIAENSWLSNPMSVAEDFSDNFMKSFSEMTLFTKANGKGIMHGDPHAGNFFVSKNEKGKFIPTFIDTGNCIERTSKEIADDLKFFTNYLVGNSEEVASYFVKKAELLPFGETREQLVKKIAGELDEKLFKSNSNITNFAKNQKLINSVLENNEIFLPAESATALKAQMQFLGTGLGLYDLIGQKDSVSILSKILPDVAKGLGQIGLNGGNPFNLIKPVIGHTYNNKETALGTLFQLVA